MKPKASRGRVHSGVETRKKGQEHQPSRPTVSVKTSRPQRDWAVYNRQLVNRGNIHHIYMNVTELNGRHFTVGRRGRPAYVRTIMETALTLRATFNLTYRATEGLMRSIFVQAGIPNLSLPTYSTLSKQAKHYAFRPPHHHEQGNVLLIDGTGVHYYSTGLWNQRKHNVTARANYVRVTLTTDAGTGLITNVVVTPDRGEGTGELSQIGELLNGQTHTYSTLVGDGAYDNTTAYETCEMYGMELVAPPQRNARYGENAERNNTLSQVHKLGSTTWKERRGYHVRSLVEADIGAFKQTLGDSTNAHTFEGAKADVLMKVNVYNNWKLQQLNTSTE